MDFQNLQDKLIEKKLNLTEYFKVSKVFRACRKPR